jgi:DNA-binding PadR family transcriptional regulator
MYGYEMARMAAAEGLTRVCPMEQSALYAYLRNLEQRGLVEWTEERVGRRPPRKLFRLTSAGKRSVDRWLRTPVGRMREVRLELLLKLYFLGESDEEAERELLRSQIAACEEYQAKLAEETPPGDGNLPRLVSMSKSSAAEATIRWLRDYAIERGATAG